MKVFCTAFPLFPLLIILLLSLTPVIQSVQAERNLPKWSDILEWLEEGDWFYYEVNVTTHNLVTKLTSRRLVKNNFTIDSIENNTIKITSYTENIFLSTGNRVAGTSEYLLNLSDKKLTGLTIPFFILSNVTNGHDPLKLPEGEWVRVNQTIIIKKIEVKLREGKIIVQAFLNRSVICSWNQEWIMIFEYDMYIELSLLKPGLALYFETNITRNFIRRETNTTSVSAQLVSANISHEIGVLKDTNVELTEEETTEVTKLLANYLLIAIPILIAIPVGAILLKRRK